MDEIRIGIIGTGMISREHVANYAKLPQAKVVAICDQNEQALECASKEFGVTDTYTDYHALLQRDDIDAVDVCLHAGLHARVTIDALRAGKHVYCEKPLAGTYSDGAAMLRAAEETGKKLHIQLRFLYRNDMRIAKKVINSGVLGDIYHLRTFELRRRGRPYIDMFGSPAFVRKKTAAGGAMMDIGIYNLSNMLYLMDCPKIQRISGQVYQKLAMDEARRSASGYDVEETGVGLVHFEGGLTMDLFDSWAAHLDKPAASCILGSKGGLRLSPMHPESSDHSKIDPMMLFSDVAGIPANTVFCEDTVARNCATKDPDDWIYSSSQGHWIGALLGKTELIPTAQIALQTALIQEGIYLSAERSREVTAEEVISHSVLTI